MGKEFDEGYFDANADAEGFISKVRHLWRAVVGL